MASAKSRGLGVALSLALISSSSALACNPECEPVAADEAMKDPALPGPFPSKVFAFFIDRSFVADQTRDETFAWPKLPEEAQTQILGLVPRLSLRSGDAILIRWISSRSFDDREEVVGLTSGPVDPELVLDPRPTFAPPEAYATPCQNQEARNHLAEAWRVRAKAAIREWEDELKKRRSAIAERIGNDLERATPPEKDTRGTDIEGALARAMLLRNGSTGVEAVLFTDLTSTVSSGVELNLTGVHVTVALFHRANPADLLRVKAEWSARVTAVGGSIDFLTRDQTNASQLQLKLGR